MTDDLGEFRNHLERIILEIEHQHTAGAIMNARFEALEKVLVDKISHIERHQYAIAVATMFHAHPCTAAELREAVALVHAIERPEG